MRARSAVVFLSAVIAIAAAGAPTRATSATARLLGIRPGVEEGRAALLIEASEPVPYATSQPDPLTVLIDLRHIAAHGSLPQYSGTPAAPVAAVTVEPASAPDGASVARVRLGLRVPAAPHVRSSRNTIVVEFENTEGGAPVVLGASPATPPSAPRTGKAVRSAPPVAALHDPPAVTQTMAAATASNESPARATARPVRPAAGSAFPAARVLQQRDQAGSATGSAAAPPAAPGIDAPDASSVHTFSGHPVSLDFQGVDLRAVLRTFAEITGLNIVIDPAVQGTVDVSLREVPWDQALDIILRANQLGYSTDGNIVRVAPLKVLSDEQAQQRKLTEERALSGDLRVVTHTLSYANARDMLPLLTKTALTRRGQVEVDDRTNTLIITDLAEGQDAADRLIAALDKAQPQVEIEARIIETAKNFSRELGIRLGIAGELSPALGNTTGVTFPNSGTVGGRIGTINDRADVLGVVLGSLNGALKIDATLSALEREGKVRVISAPRIVTQNNIEAEVTQGTQIPYTTATQAAVPSGGNGSTVVSTFQVPTVQFKDAALKLVVRPRITASGTVIMDVNLERSAADYSSVIPGNPNPAITTQKAKTSVQVDDGATAVIGGVMFEQDQNNDDRTPGLHKIPFLGALFKRNTASVQSRELVLFITPRIVK